MYTLTQGTFDPGTKIGFRTVAKWHVTDNVKRPAAFGCYHVKVRVTFTDGTYIDALQETKYEKGE